MLELEVQEKNAGYISYSQMKKEGQWRIKRISPMCEVCLSQKGFKLIRQYTEFFFKNKSLYILACDCCNDRIELETFEYKQIKKIVKLNRLRALGKLSDSQYNKKMNPLL